MEPCTPPTTLATQLQSLWAQQFMQTSAEHGNHAALLEAVAYLAEFNEQWY